MVLAKSGRQRTMFGRIVERKRAVEMRATFREFTSEQQRNAQDAMPHHQRDCRPLALER
jgi:hypothetical protein